MAVNTNEKVRRKILTGNLWSVVLSVTLPLFLYQLINSVYSVVDALMLVKIDTAASSAGAILAQVKTLLSSFGSGISAGGAILIAKYYGAGDIKKAKKYANVTFAWELIIIVLSLLIFLPLAEPIMRLTGCNDELVKIAHNYFRLQIVELCIININSVFIAIQKSKGKTRIILISNIIMMAIKLGLNALLIYGFKVDDMTWIEVASVLSQLFMLVLGSFYLFNKNAIFRIELKELTLDWKYSKKLLIISLPMFAGKFVISLGKVAVNSICSTFIEGDSLLVGALGISNNLSGLVTNPTVALEDSESGIVSQNLGNKNMKRTFKVMLISLCYVTIWSTIGFLLVRVFYLDEFAALFISTKQGSEASSIIFAELIKKIFYYDCLSIPALTINAVVLGVLYGYGQTFLATLNNVIRIVTRISVLLICKSVMDTSNLDNAATAAGLSMGISNIVIAIFAIVMFIIFFFKVKAKGFKGMKLTDSEPEMIEVDGILVRKDSIKEA